MQHGVMSCPPATILPQHKIAVTWYSVMSCCGVVLNSFSIVCLAAVHLHIPGYKPSPSAGLIGLGVVPPYCVILLLPCAIGLYVTTYLLLSHRLWAMSVLCYTYSVISYGILVCQRVMVVLQGHVIVLCYSVISYGILVCQEIDDSILQGHVIVLCCSVISYGILVCHRMIVALQGHAIVLCHSVIV